MANDIFNLKLGKEAEKFYGKEFVMECCSPLRTDGVKSLRLLFQKMQELNCIIEKEEIATKSEAIKFWRMMKAGIILLNSVLELKAQKPNKISELEEVILEIWTEEVLTPKQEKILKQYTRNLLLIDSIREFYK